MDSRLQKYIEVAVGVGVNIQPGQNLVISCNTDQAHVARMAMAQAYRLGAADVMISWSDEGTERTHYLMAPEDNFGKVTEWERAKMQHTVDNKYHVLSIESDDPENYKGVDENRIEKDDVAYSQMYKPRSDQTMSGEIQWSIFSVPSLAWAKKVFPKAISDEQALDQMWEAIYAASRIDHNDPVENWKAHIATLQSKAKQLNNFRFASLHFKNSLGTDLTVQLPDGHNWLTCGEMAKTGFEFVANIPTEEVFTAPHREGVDGVVYATKPLVHYGELIENFWFRFEKGKVVEYKAEKNQHLLEKLLTTHEAADFLGEVALVPHSSPISKSGILWYETLYDENAACHLALGEGYSDCITGAYGKSDEQQLAMGLNQSHEHTDFMIGSEDMDIVGITSQGQKVSIFKAGEWAI